MPTSPPESRLFGERQWLASVWWVDLLVLVCAGLGWQTLIDPPESVSPWLTWVFVGFAGVLLPVLAFSCRLDTIVAPEGVTLRYFPLRTRLIAASEIDSAEASTYRPFKEYGGWGIRGWGDDKAYTVRGNRGVRLELADGASVLVGSQRPEQLAEALYRMARHVR